MNDKKINLAFITTLLDTGGAERHWEELICAIDHTRFNIILICLYHLGPIGEKIKASGVPTYSGILSNKFSVFGVIKLIRILKDNNISLAFLIKQPVTIAYTILATRFTACRNIVVAFHGTSAPKNKIGTFLFNRVCALFVTRFVAIGTKHKIHLINSDYIPANKITIIFNGTNIGRFGREIDRAAKKRSLGIPVCNKVVAIVARLHAIKRHEIFLKMAQIVSKEFNEVTFLVVGEGKEKNNITAMIDSLGIGEKVKLLGLRTDIEELNKIIDVSVLSSGKITETLPMTLIEAMASAVPVVSTDVGSISDLILNGQNGFLVPHESPEKLAHAVLRVLKDDDLASKMGIKGKDLATARFSTEAMAKNYEDLFTSLHG